MVYVVGPIHNATHADHENFQNNSTTKLLQYRSSGLLNCKFKM